MENAENDRATSLEKALAQVGTHTDRCVELLQVHQQCLKDVMLRSQGLNDPRKALGPNSEATVAQGERDAAQYFQGTRRMYQRTTDRAQIIRDRQ